MRPWARLALGLSIFPAVSGAVGVDGASASRARVGAGVAFALDQVGGFGRDAYPAAELFMHAEARVWNWLAIGGAVSLREDLGDYNYALDRWRGGFSTGVAAQLFFGYDADTFHLSLGPWIYGDSRNGQSFRAGFLPYGVLRFRVGDLDHWHLKLRVADGAPFTADGAGAAARLLLGFPATGGHRFSVGPYFTIGESTAGLSAVDEIQAGGRTIRVGGILGAAYSAGFSRPELSVFVGALL